MKNISMLEYAGLLMCIVSCISVLKGDDIRGVIYCILGTQFFMWEFQK